MFKHAERFPTGTPIPTGRTTPPPWGLSRLTPYPSAGTQQPTRVEIDPETQTTRCFDAAGAPVAAPGHGTSSGTNPSTGTSPDGHGHGGGDTDTGNDTDQ
ncbi:putative ATP-grasp-modified RiPP [Streptomyces sp. NPDC046939]|uniref:putative ATP-grasp-modified RiPP n=1 Tax=Streptomyces sp. NPDC046939 TaxID=3155376 RepID=UPI0033D1345C